ncbi:H-type lectin domain-containing protein [Shimia biformata]|uniref:H-type lectin domain-containing protein n=1 Tax=Shimia biformata TaxID=1294299 RepID=UPI00194E6F1E|nr:H-type lectin domain-containing protein [Shimia biformata]
MKKLRNSLVGLDQGDVLLFTDFEDGGEMWTGDGTRERRQKIRFAEKYKTPPVVHVSLSLWDMDSGPNIRAEAVAEKVSNSGFDLVFRTWADSRVARVRLAWLAIGELRHNDDWDVE